MSSILYSKNSSDSLPSDNAVHFFKTQPNECAIFDTPLFSDKIKGHIAAYAFSHFFSNIEKLFYSSTEIPLIVNLVKSPDIKHRKLFRQKLIGCDARDLYSDAVNATEMIRIIQSSSPSSMKNLKEGFQFSKICLEDALRKKIYKSIINCMLFTYVDSEMIATQNKYQIQRIILNKQGTQSPINSRLIRAAQYTIKPRDCLEAISVLPTLSPPDVPMLLCYFTPHSENLNRALSIWSNIVSGRGSETWSYKHQRILMQDLGIQGKTANKRISAIQRGANRSDVFESEPYTEIKGLGMPADSSTRDLQQLDQESDRKIEREELHISPTSKSTFKILDFSEWKIADETALVKTALQNGANPNALDNNQMVPLWKCKNVEAAALLITYKALPSLTDHSGNHALHFSVKNGAIKVTKLLLQQSKQLIDKPNKQGRTPLHNALITLKVLTASFEIAHYLLDQGAKIDLPDEAGVTTYTIASNYFERLKGLSLEISEENAKVVDETRLKLTQMQPLYEKFKARALQDELEKRKPKHCCETNCQTVYSCFLACLPCCFR